MAGLIGVIETQDCLLIGRTLLLLVGVRYDWLDWLTACDLQGLPVLPLRLLGQIKAQVRIGRLLLIRHLILLAAYGVLGGNLGRLYAFMKHSRWLVHGEASRTE